MKAAEMVHKIPRRWSIFWRLEPMRRMQGSSLSPVGSSRADEWLVGGRIEKGASMVTHGHNGTWWKEKKEGGGSTPRPSGGEEEGGGTGTRRGGGVGRRTTWENRGVRIRGRYGPAAFGLGPQ
jgi:hypothetical protein